MIGPSTAKAVKAAVDAIVSHVESWRRQAGATFQRIGGFVIVPARASGRQNDLVVACSRRKVCSRFCYAISWGWSQMLARVQFTSARRKGRRNFAASEFCKWLSTAVQNLLVWLSLETPALSASNGGGADTGADALMLRVPPIHLKTSSSPDQS